MERAYLDATPYTPGQLSWLPQAYGVVSGAWSKLAEDGLNLTSAPGRFSDVYSLTIDGFGWMNSNPIDLLDHRRILDEASGDVLLTGLGLGVGVLFANANPNVESITVLEKDERVARLIWPMVSQRLQTRCWFVLADADEYDYSPESYNFAFIDHAAEAPPVETVARIAAFSETVVVWWEEVHEVLASWQ